LILIFIIILFCLSSRETCFIFMLLLDISYVMIILIVIYLLVR